MIKLADKRNCVGCANCLQVCPQQCISIFRDSEGFGYPTVDENRCVNCQKCDQVCPVKLGSLEIKDRIETKAFGAFHKDVNIRMKSTSGGVFYSLAEDAIKRNSLVYGAALLTDHLVKHVSARSVTELSRLQGAKYVQSDIFGVFPEISKELQAGTLVVFSGTPCQVKALYAFLGTRPINLLTIDLICHGVSSPLVFDRYLREEKANHMIFRNKERSWQQYDVAINKENGHIIRQRAAHNPFMRAFLQNWILRPSCSQCPSKSFSSGADITLGDFWGVASIAPGLFDDKGTSVVFVHTKKGENAWGNVCGLLQSAEVPLDSAFRNNPSIFQSAEFPKDRASFFNELALSPVKTSLNKYAGEKPFMSVKRYLLSIWNSLFDSVLRIKNRLLKYNDFFYSKFHKKPKVMGIEETLGIIIRNGYSVCRFGDGELKLIKGGQTWFQESVPLLQQRLKEILKNHQPNLLVCVPNIFDSLSSFTEPNRNYWSLHIARDRRIWYRFMDCNQTYYDAFISRCYLPYIDKKQTAHFFALWKNLWEGKDLIIIEGEKTRFGVGNNLLANAHSVKRILCSNTQAFTHYDKIKNTVKQLGQHFLVLLALGPTATVLASDLCLLGYQAIDVGHLDIEYEWFLRGVEGKVPIPGKYVNEAGGGYGVGPCEDEQYIREIICRC